MQHEMMRHPAPPPVADNVGDVLASIRQLIAQDEAGDPIPDQAPSTLPGLDITPLIRVEPILSAPPRISATVIPLVLDSNDLVAASPPTEKQAQPDPGIAATKADGAEVHAFSDWLKLPLTGPAETPPAVAEPQADQPDPDRMTTAEAVTPVPDIGFQPELIQPFAPFLADPTTTVQMEETMLHANASVTPINPAAEAQAAAEALGRDTEPHLFAPQDRDAQKGTHLRGMIREAIRQELQGEIGNRLSRNLQQMIRHEIELTLRQMCEQE